MDIRHILFKYRSYTPIPLILVALVIARPTWLSFMLGSISVFIGEMIRFCGVAYAGSATRTTARAGGERLITDGPFGYVRNPLYLGNFFLSFGFMLMCWPWMPWMCIIFLILFGIQYGCIVLLEEEYLSNQFGEQYDDYRKNVRKWVPCIRAYKGREQCSPNFSKALKSERNTFQAIITVCVLILLRWHVF